MASDEEYRGFFLAMALLVYWLVYYTAWYIWIAPDIVWWSIMAVYIKLLLKMDERTCFWAEILACTCFFLNPRPLIWALDSRPQGTRFIINDLYNALFRLSIPLVLATMVKLPIKLRQLELYIRLCLDEVEGLGRPLDIDLWRMGEGTFPPSPFGEEQKEPPAEEQENQPKDAKPSDSHDDPSPLKSGSSPESGQQEQSKDTKPSDDTPPSFENGWEEALAKARKGQPEDTKPSDPSDDPSPPEHAPPLKPSTTPIPILDINDAGVKAIFKGRKPQRPSRSTDRSTDAPEFFGISIGDRFIPRNDKIRPVTRTSVPYYSRGTQTEPENPPRTLFMDTNPRTLTTLTPAQTEEPRAVAQSDAQTLPEAPAVSFESTGNRNAEEPKDSRNPKESENIIAEEPEKSRESEETEGIKAEGLENSRKSKEIEGTKAEEPENSFKSDESESIVAKDPEGSRELKEGESTNTEELVDSPKPDEGEGVIAAEPEDSRESKEDEVAISEEVAVGKRDVCEPQETEGTKAERLEDPHQPDEGEGIVAGEPEDSLESEETEGIKAEEPEEPPRSDECEGIIAEELGDSRESEGEGINAEEPEASLELEEGESVITQEVVAKELDDSCDEGTNAEESEEPPKSEGEGTIADEPEDSLESKEDEGATSEEAAAVGKRDDVCEPQEREDTGAKNLDDYLKSKEYEGTITEELVYRDLEDSPEPEEVEDTNVEELADTTESKRETNIPGDIKDETDREMAIALAALEIASDGDESQGEPRLVGDDNVETAEPTTTLNEETNAIAAGEQHIAFSSGSDVSGMSDVQHQSFAVLEDVAPKEIAQEESVPMPAPIETAAAQDPAPVSEPTTEVVEPVPEVDMAIDPPTVEHDYSEATNDNEKSYDEFQRILDESATLDEYLRRSVNDNEPQPSEDPWAPIDFDFSIPGPVEAEQPEPEPTIEIDDSKQQETEVAHQPISQPSEDPWAPIDFDFNIPGPVEAEQPKPEPEPEPTIEIDDSKQQETEVAHQPISQPSEDPWAPTDFDFNISEPVETEQPKLESAMEVDHIEQETEVAHQPISQPSEDPWAPTDFDFNIPEPVETEQPKLESAMEVDHIEQETEVAHQPASQSEHDTNMDWSPEAETLLMALDANQEPASTEPVPTESSHAVEAPSSSREVEMGDEELRQVLLTAIQATEAANEVQATETANEVQATETANEVQATETANEVQATETANEVQVTETANEDEDVEMTQEEQDAELERELIAAFEKPTTPEPEAPAPKESFPSWREFLEQRNAQHQPTSEDEGSQLSDEEPKGTIESRPKLVPKGRFTAALKPPQVPADEPDTTLSSARVEAELGTSSAANRRDSGQTASALSAPALSGSSIPSPLEPTPPSASAQAPENVAPSGLTPPGGDEVITTPSGPTPSPAPAQASENIEPAPIGSILLPATNEVITDPSEPTPLSTSIQAPENEAPENEAPENVAPIQMGGLLLPGGNEVITTPSEPTPSPASTQAPENIAPVLMGGLLLPGGNEVITTSSESGPSSGPSQPTTPAKTQKKLPDLEKLHRSVTARMKAKPSVFHTPKKAQPSQQRVEEPADSGGIKIISPAAFHAFYSQRLPEGMQLEEAEAANEEADQEAPPRRDSESMEEE